MCKSCGGQVIQPVSKKTLASIPKITPNQTLYLEYVVPYVSSHRPKGIVSGEEYYFKSSPRNARGKKVVDHEPPYTNNEILYDDAVYLSEMSINNQTMYAWRVETVPQEIIEAEIIEKAEPEIEGTASAIEEVEETKIAIDIFSISKAQEELVDLSSDIAQQLIEDEREGKNRKGMIDFLETFLGKDILPSLDEEE